MPVKPGMTPQFTASGLQARGLPAGGKQLPMMDQRPRGKLTPEQAAQYEAQTGGMQGKGLGSFGNKLLGGAAAGGLGAVSPVMGGLAGSALSKVFGRGGGSLFGGMSDAIRRAAGQVMNAPGGEGDGGGYPLQGPKMAPGYQVGEGMMGFGAFARPFGPQDLMTNLAPNYQFMKEQGLGAVMQGANVGGGGSNVQRGAIKFAEDYARNAYQDALNNYRLQQGDIFNRLTNLTGTGQTAQQNIGSTAGQFGSNISQLGIGAAQAQAAGQVGAANAMAGGLGNIGGLLGTYGLLKAFPQS